MHHRCGPDTSRRIPSLGPLGAATLALAVLATACSGTSAVRPAAAGSPVSPGAATGAGTDPGTGPSPSAVSGSPAGTVDTDAADPPILNPTLQPGEPVPTGYRVPPSTLRPPASWDPSPWLNQIRTAAGSTATPSNSKDALYTTTAWKWSAPGIDTLSAGVVADGQNHPLKITCDAEGFDASAPAIAAEITRTLELCAQTGLSGTEAQAAQSWIGRQIGPVLDDIRTGFRGTVAISAAPSFGAATYQVAANYEFQFGYLIQVIVW